MMPEPGCGRRRSVGAGRRGVRILAERAKLVYNAFQRASPDASIIEVK